MKLTRRQLAAALVVAPAPLGASPQAEDLDTTARERLKSTAAALNTVQLPMSTEPAVTFRVL